MTDSNQARKNAARRRSQATGKGYQAAQADDRRDRMGFDRAAEGDTRRPAPGTAYLTAWGVDALADDTQVQALVEHAEQHGRPGADDPITCHLCDEPIDTTREAEVHLGLVLREVRPGGGAPVEAQMPVWTHEACGQTRVWSWSQLTLERRRRRLPVDPADLPPKERRRTAHREEDFYVFTVPPGAPPVLYLQPGTPSRHGPLGWRADRLSDGLPELDLTRQEPPALAEWTLAADDGLLSHIERRGTGYWYQPPRPWSPPAPWLQAARRHGGAIVLTAPAKTVPPAQLEAGAGDLSALAQAGRAGLLFGARMQVTGL